MDGGADCRPDLFPRRPGLGLGAVSCRGDRLAHIPGLATTVTAPIRVPAVPAGVGATFATAVTTAVVAATPSVTTVTATAVTTPTATALSVGNVVVDRQKGSRQTAKEWDQCDHDDCQYQIPEERCHGWTLLYNR
jgi:hypothetical protein